jgi:hypothetical protein
MMDVIFHLVNLFDLLPNERNKRLLFLISACEPESDCTAAQAMANRHKASFPGCTGSTPHRQRTDTINGAFIDKNLFLHLD